MKQYNGEKNGKGGGELNQMKQTNSLYKNK